MGVLPELKGRDTSSLRAIPCGGSAVPRALSEGYREQTGPPDHAGLGHDGDEPDRVGGPHQVDARRRRSTTRAEPTCAPPSASRRSASTPASCARAAPSRCRGTARARASSRCAGPWIASEYYNDERSPESFTEDGWLKTGDVAVIDHHGYIRLVDRTKDVIKSGGEWISSVDLENELMGHPKVAEAAVIGVPHPKWSERPLACVVVRPGEELTKDEVLGLPRGQGRQVVAARRRRVRRRDPEDERRASSPRRTSATSSRATSCPPPEASPAPYPGR